MLIYTPLPLELIWEDADKFAPVYHEIRVGNITLQVEPMAFGRCKVIRLLSTNPYDYLQDAYQPGKIIELLPSSPAEL